MKKLLVLILLSGCAATPVAVKKDNAVVVEKKDSVVGHTSPERCSNLLSLFCARIEMCGKGQYDACIQSGGAQCAEARGITEDEARMCATDLMEAKCVALIPYSCMGIADEPEPSL